MMKFYGFRIELLYCQFFLTKLLLWSLGDLNPVDIYNEWDRFLA